MARRKMRKLSKRHSTSKKYLPATLKTFPSNRGQTRAFLNWNIKQYSGKDSGGFLVPPAAQNLYNYALVLK